MSSVGAGVHTGPSTEPQIQGKPRIRFLAEKVKFELTLLPQHRETDGKHED